jgi:hypothetical protein
MIMSALDSGAAASRRFTCQTVFGLSEVLLHSAPTEKFSSLNCEHLKVCTIMTLAKVEGVCRLTASLECQPLMF